ncbi:hypothetical protein [Butyricimonas sp.]|uniref:hypothetical protein n=1 Tax=Butyricimonas sp. TaxID=1969738 RepID=UPI0025C28F29|nr:hypothetical protein [Butyricimonas sp.]
MKEKSMTDENMSLLLKNSRTLIDKVNLLLENWNITLTPRQPNGWIPERYGVS